MNNAEKGIQILQLTNDGDDLSPNQLSLLELAANNHLSELGQQAFNDLYQNILVGDYQEYFHSIEHLTVDHEGYIYWKGKVIEHYSFQDYEEEKKAAEQIAAKCRYLESINVEVSWSTV
ncbi:hypothetical protein [Nostoc sp. JL33]|uniref:hypothetical protein n=1 Tax=Nostoc sp. JL33 TaxID=2815396 RepID=UPI0025D92EB0|nr:hypothetical protein [Nostoc sp. JL33]MBN3869540.1 hypothetical protein [Nostoc sp. JL33]